MASMASQGFLSAILMFIYVLPFLLTRWQSIQAVKVTNYLMLIHYKNCQLRIDGFKKIFTAKYIYISMIFHSRSSK